MEHGAEEDGAITLVEASRPWQHVRLAGEDLVQGLGLVDLQLEAVELDGVRGATKAGIALVHQELNLAENLDVAGSIFLAGAVRDALKAHAILR